VDRGHASLRGLPVEAGQGKRLPNMRKSYTDRPGHRSEASAGSTLVPGAMSGKLRKL
jgi:hypothetical protein